jgi:DNA helicase-2/ATP-dependent DNA helicase PcrA
VLVVLDDEKGTRSQFSYGKYLGYVGLSAVDAKNIANGRVSA